MRGRWLLLLALLWGQDSLWPGRILFGLNSGYTLANLPEELRELSQALGVTRLGERFPGLKMAAPVYVAEYSAALPPTYVAKLWKRHPAIAYAEPEYIPKPLTSPERLSYTPNDPSLSTCYWLPHLHVYEAWDSTQGDTNFVWAVVDTDVRFDHPDLVSSIAYNWADPINGIDDDGDGYVDNFHGWDLVGPTYGGSGSFSPDNDPRTASAGHGSYVAAYGGATPDNGEGIAGPAFKCRLLPIKAAPDDSWSLYAAYDGLLYAAQHGAKVINASWGSTAYSQAAQNFVSSLVSNYDVLLVAAAGNIPPSQGTKFYPAMYDGVVSVTAVQTSDQWTGGVQAYYGIDLCTTGWGTTVAGTNGYHLLGQATSFAAPHASGCAILLRSWRPDLNARQIAELLRITGDSVDHLNPTLRYQLGRRINLYRAIITTDTPACRIKTWQAVDGNDDLFFPGETLSISATYINYLSPATNLVVSLSSLSPYIQLVDSVYAVGNLGTLAQHQQASAFRVVILPSAPLDATGALLFTYTADGGYVDYEVQELKGINPPYVHLPTAQLKTTISGNGRIGYHDTPQNRQGLGVRWQNNTASWLFEGGVVIAETTTAHLCTRAAGGGMYSDFAPASPASRTYTGLYEIGHVSMTNSGLTETSPLSLAIQLHTYGFRHEVANPFVAFVYEIENTSAQSYDSLAIGWWLDWDVGNNPATDVAGVEAGYRLVYARSGSSRYVGAMLLSPHQAVLHVGQVDTFVPSRGQYARLFQGLSPTTSVTGDVFNVIAAKDIDIAPGERDTIVFALVGGNSWAELLANADEALAWYQCFMSQAAPVVDLGPNRALCFGDSVVPYAPTATEFYWTSGELSAVLYPTQTGVYGLYVRDASGCWGYDEVEITIDTLRPADVQFVPGLALTVGETLTGSDQGPAYQRIWRVETPSGWVSYTGPTFQHTFTSVGTYRVRLIRTDPTTGCVDSLEWQVQVGTSALPIRAMAWGVWPNPTSGEFVIQGVPGKAAVLRLFDRMGRCVWETPFEVGSLLRLPSYLAAGLYVWQIGAHRGLLLYAP